MSEALIAAEDVKVVFPIGRNLFGRPRQWLRAVDGSSLSVGANETLALVGESGSGKSTLGAAMLGLQPLTSGAVRWRGEDMKDMSRQDWRSFRRQAQMVFQDPYGSLNPRLTVGETLRRPLAVHAEQNSAADQAQAEHWLEAVGLRPADLYIDRYPHEFSGGQRQRIAIARALILRPSFVVADEPVSALDVSLRAQILALFDTLRADLAFSLLFLSHDLGVVRFIADRVAVMYLGKIVETGAAEDIFTHPHHPYTRALLAAAPSVRGVAPANVVGVEAVGEPPKPTDPPSGCRFRTRCPFAFARCVTEEPMQREVSPGQMSACHLN